MNAIMHYQEEYFLDGDETKLKPMILKDIADMVGLDISTISAANSKYVETPYGTKLIKEFFRSDENDQGEDVSTLKSKKLQNTIRRRKNHSDDQLAEIKRKRLSIARRTIAKYREQPISGSRMRKKM
jgi:RNA polymerase sigma-54 factor